ncbi:unnamed protein product [Closterium sp. NIES-53]
MTHSASFLTNIGAPRDVTSVVFGNDKSLPVVGVGSTRLIVDGGPVDITNVLHVPGLKVNLLSVTQLTKKGVKVTIDDAKMNLFWKGKQFAQGVLNGELYQLKMHPGAASSNVAQGSKETLKAWHNRLAHANYDSVKELANKGLAKGVDVVAGDDETGVCAACVEGKMARKPFGSRTSPLAKDPLALVHMDSKGDAAKAIKEWVLEVCNDDKKRIKVIRTDGGGEFVNNELAKWMKSKGIKHDVTTPYTPQQNGAAERLNRTLVEAEQPMPQLTVVLPAREEDEAVEVPSQVEKEAENGGGENEESDEDVVEVPSTEAATSSTPSSLPLALTREQRIRRPNTKYNDYAMVAVGELDEERAAYCFTTLGDDPRTHTEALASPDAPLWKQAMEKEDQRERRV